MIVNSQEAVVTFVFSSASRTFSIEALGTLSILSMLFRQNSTNRTNNLPSQSLFGLSQKAHPVFRDKHCVTTHIMDTKETTKDDKSYLLKLNYKRIVKPMSNLIL